VGAASQPPTKNNKYGWQILKKGASTSLCQGNNPVPKIRRKKTETGSRPDPGTSTNFGPSNMGVSTLGAHTMTVQIRG